MGSDTGLMQMEETANSMECAPSLRGHLSVTALETWDSTETSLLNREVPARGTGYYIVTANHKHKPESSSSSSQEYRTS